MSTPVVVEDIGGYTFAWPDQQIKVIVSQCHIHASDGRITGTLRVETTAPGYKPLLHSPAQFNFTSTRSRDELAKRLTTRIKEVDWYAVLEKATDEVVSRQMAGEPVEELCTAEDVKPPEMILHPLLAQGLPTVVFGDRGSAKSTLSLAWAQIVQLPWPDSPLEMSSPPGSWPVLYLDWETNRETILWQMKKLQNAMSPNMAFFMPYRRCRVPLAADVDQIRSRLRTSGAKIVIIDSLGPACGGDLNSSQPAMDFFSALSQLKVTSLILAHTAKNGDANKRSVFGSSFFENEARNIWEIRALQEAGEDTLEVGLFHRKPLPYMGKQKPFGYKLSFTETSTMIEPQNPEQVHEFKAAMGTQKQIEQYLLDQGQASTDSIANALDISEGAVQQALKRLKGKNKAACLKSADGKWKWCILSNQEVPA